MDRNGQLGLIAFFAQQVGPTNHFGRKALQKLVHIATDFVGVPTGYQFSFYTYGPYSQALASDLELAEQLLGIVSKRDETSGAFDIKAGPLANKLIEISHSQLSNQMTNLNWTVENFGKLTAKSLELYSTLIFLRNNNSSYDSQPQDLFSQVIKLKPKYDINEIEVSYKKLIELEKTLQPLQ